MAVRRFNYEAPVARDLSDLTAAGQVTQGICERGSVIQTDFTCINKGTTPYSDPATCAPVGTNPTLGGCGKGNYAESACNSGASD